MELDKYLQLAQLHLDSNVLAKSVADYMDEFRLVADGDIPSGNEDMLYSYKVPRLSPDGSCAMSDTADPESYDISKILGGRSPDTTPRLAILNELVNHAAGAMSVDWLGIYQRLTKNDGSDVLVKLAYYGAMSRAEFPLNEEFAAQSNNSTVGMTGAARIINDIPEYIKSNGPYYSCDRRVKAEACLPLFAPNSITIVGIIDAEAWRTDFFTNKTLAFLLALCIVTPDFLI